MKQLSSILFYLLQIAFVGTIFGYGTLRYQQEFSAVELPQPNNEPIRLQPQNSRPDYLSEAQLIETLEKLKPQLRGKNPKINFVDHALRFWGIEAAFTDDACLSGVEMRDLLLDHRVFQDAWGPEESPFLVPDFQRNTTLLSMKTKEGASSASHTDHSLASLAEVGTPLDFPVMTPQGEIPLLAALDYTLDSFSLNQQEYEWSTMVFLHYLPHVDQWQSREGQTITWDRIADRLMRQRLASGVCFGNHRLFALVGILQVDKENGLITDEKREQIITHLKDATDRLVRTQHEDGYWDAKWPGDEWDGPQLEDRGSPLGDQADRILATGHALEWWSMAPAEVLPPEETLRKAITWTHLEIQSLSDSQVQRYYTFLTHAGRALSLWQGKAPHEAWANRHTTTPNQQLTSR